MDMDSITVNENEEFRHWMDQLDHWISSLLKIRHVSEPFVFYSRLAKPFHNYNSIIESSIVSLLVRFILLSSLAFFLFELMGLFYCWSYIVVCDNIFFGLV